MDKEEKKQTGVSLFGQSEYLVGSDPIEEMFALNLGDFISENLISEDLAKKISSKSNKKERPFVSTKFLIMQRAFSLFLTSSKELLTII